MTIQSDVQSDGCYKYWRSWVKSKQIKRKPDTGRKYKKKTDS